MGLEQGDELAIFHDYSRALIESSLDLIFILDAQAMFKYISPAVEKVLGYSQDEVTGRSVYEFLRFDEVKKALSLIERLTREQATGERYEFHVERKDCSWVRVEVVGENFLDNPEINGIVVSARDITRRRKAQCELTQAEERFKAIIDSISETIAIVDVEGSVHFVGEPVYRMLGFSPEEIRSMNVYDLVHPEDLERSIDIAIGLGAKPGARATSIIRAMDRNGKWHHIEATSINYSDNTYIAGIMAVARDVTERIEKEEKLGEALKTLIDSASEELRQHVTVLKGYASLLRNHRDEMGEEMLDSIFETMEASTDSLNKLIKGISYAEDD